MNQTLMNGKRPLSDAYDPDLYHRALTGRGEPIEPQEVIALLEALEEQTAEVRRASEYEDLKRDYDALEKEHEELKTEHEELEGGQERYESHCKELNSELANLRASFDIFRAKHETLEAQHAALKAQHEALQADKRISGPADKRTRKGWRP